MTELVQSIRVADARELYDAVAELIETARVDGYAPEEVYVEGETFALLIREKLSDGSAVLNLRFRNFL